MDSTRLKTAAAALVLLLSASALASALLRSDASTAAESPAMRVPVGQEEPRPDAAFVNGFNVANIGACAFQEAYSRAALLLGPPIAGFTGRSQSFVYGRLVCVLDAPPEQRVQWANLGLDEMRLRGLLPQPGSEPAPAVRAHLLGALETGLDPAEIFGRVLSAPVCNGDGRCRQYTDKQVLLFERDATAADAASWAPLGLWHRHPDRSERAGTSGVGRWPLLILGAAGCLGGLALLLHGRGGHSRRSATI